jgi:hypothetical protein
MKLHFLLNLIRLEVDVCEQGVVSYEVHHFGGVEGSLLELNFVGGQ